MDISSISSSKYHVCKQLLCVMKYTEGISLYIIINIFFHHFLTFQVLKEDNERLKKYHGTVDEPSSEQQS